MNQEYAFPQSLQAGDRAQSTGWLTLRDYFAAKALQGYLASFDPNGEPVEFATRIAEDAYAMSDAMLAERAKGASNG